MHFESHLDSFENVVRGRCFIGFVDTSSKVRALSCGVVKARDVLECQGIADDVEGSEERMAVGLKTLLKI